MCVCSPLSQYNFIICGPIATKLDMKVAGYDKRWNSSKVKVKVG